MKDSGDEEITETIKFVDYFDKFFDSLNVNNFWTGMQKKKAFKQPYTSGKDFQMKVHIVYVADRCVWQVTV